MNKKSLIGIIIVAALAIAMLFVYKAYAPKPELGTKEINVTINHLDGVQKELRLSTDADYLRAALEAVNLISGPETEYGLWLETVDGETLYATYANLYANASKTYVEL